MLRAKSFFSNTQQLYIIGLSTMAIGLSLSKPLIGLGQLIIGLAWILEGNFKQKIQSFFTNKLALAVILFFIISIIGLANSSNYSYAFTDIKRKIPLFVLPFVLFGVRFSQQQLKLIFKIYVAGVILASLWSIFVKLGGLGTTIIDDRELSRFNSHIRFGLEICIAIFGLGYYIVKESNQKTKIYLSLALIWLILFLFILHLYTGVLIFAITSIFLMLIYGIKTTNLKQKFILLFFPIILVVSATYYINQSVKKFYTQQHALEEMRYSPYGEVYQNDWGNDDKENGYLVYRNIAPEELEYAWNKVSIIHYREKDLKGQPISTTLIRYITSKGEYKNQKSVMALTPKEIKEIERGITNCNSLKTNAFDRRMQSTIWEFDNYNRRQDYNGHSTVMRWVYWKTAFKIFKNNTWFGVGTGDIQDAFNQQYNKENSLLIQKYRLRAHNQFITAFTTFGIFGGLFFLAFLFYPFVSLNLKNNFLYLAFFIIMIVSMFTEDTLDTQVGITLFAFFNSLIIYNKDSI